MATQERPDRQKGRFGFIKRMAGSTGSTITRHPSLAAGSVAFAVAFGFVTINALQFQSGKHPAPFFDTRHPPVRKLVAKTETIPVPTRKVTTYRVGQQDPVRTASIPQDQPELNNPVFQIQQALGRLGIYDGETDGIPGPRTREAIMEYQKRAKLDVTGDLSDELLVHVRMTGMSDVVMPRPKPVFDEIETIISPRAPLTEEESRPAPGGAPAEAGLIMNIQTGLSKLAYADIDIDGVAGERTTTAIRDFQKHYNLPVTGQPDERVLTKLKEIGAL